MGSQAGAGVVVSYFHDSQGGRGIGREFAQIHEFSRFLFGHEFRRNGQCGGDDFIHGGFYLPYLFFRGRLRKQIIAFAFFSFDVGVAVAGGGLGFVEVFDEPAGEIVVAVVVVIEDAEDIEHCGFARIRSAHDGDQFALGDLQINAFEHVERVRFLTERIYRITASIRTT